MSALVSKAHAKRIKWMQEWCGRNGLILVLEGECGFGRECVGVTNGHTYPDYRWHDKDWNRADSNGQVWTPDDAYHKHDCVAVLGRGEAAEKQLHDWLRWFDSNGFVVDQGKHEGRFDPIEVMLGQHQFCRMVRKGGAA